MQDFSQLSSKTVTEVLMLEMKMAPAAKAYLISGYPRSMRDVVEYSEKVISNYAQLIFTVFAINSFIYYEAILCCRTLYLPGKLLLNYLN